MIALLLVALELAAACACPPVDEPAPAKVERLRAELRAAELAVIAERINRDHRRKAVRK